jgi:SAM-dependent methyltransferase
MAEREQRLVFGEDAELYDRARPGYLDALIDEVVALPGGEVRALDAGCGTGKATVMLATRGVTGVGLEPHPDMAALARRNLAPFGDRWTVVEQGFEDEDGHAQLSEPFDLVTAAQAWHWFDPAKRLERAHALLRPGGWLALFWNKHFFEPTLMRRRFDELYARYAPSFDVYAPGGRRHDWVGDPDQPPGWDEIRCRTYAGSQLFERDEYLDLMRTSSDHRLLEPEPREALFAGLGEAIDEFGGGRLELPFLVSLWAARRA